MFRILARTLVLCAALTLVPTCPAAEIKPLLASWLDAQEQIQTWSADFVQTRVLKALTQPLTATGHVWFASPNQFRWELGNPPQTIAVRAADELLILYPRLKRVERFPLKGEQTGPWRDALALLEAGFPRSQAQLTAQYHVVSQEAGDQVCEVTLEPKSASARRMIPQVKIVFDVRTFLLKATQLQFADGSTMRNDFRDAVLNPEIDPVLFRPEIPAGFKVVEPLGKKS